MTDKPYYENLFGTQTTASTGTTQKAPTAEEIIGNIQKAVEQMRALTFVPPTSLRILENPYCLATRPVKEHKIRQLLRPNYAQYHRRIQKKWLKRFGTTSKPTAYMTPYGIICHPSIANSLREELPPSSLPSQHLGTLSPILQPLLWT